MNEWASGRQGWDDVDDPGDGDGNSDRRDQGGVRTFWMPPEKTKRIMFLDSAPFCFYEHSLYALTKSGKDKEVCLRRNGIDDRGCPVCEHKIMMKGKLKNMWPSYIGYFTIIEMGDVISEQDGSVRLEGWVSDNGVNYQFGKKLFGAKRGGKDKPGVLKELQRQIGIRGIQLKGTVWNVYRSGKLTEGCGDKFDFLEVVEPSDWEEYLISLGADEERLDLTPVDYADHFIPSSFEELERKVGKGGNSGTVKEQASGGGRTEGAGYGDDSQSHSNKDFRGGPENDDIPF